MTESPKETQAEFARQFYNRISGAYDLLSDASEQAYRQAGQEALALQPGSRVLEIGFGTGNGVLELARRIGAGGSVSGIDISPGMLEVAQGKIDKDPPDATIDLQVGDAGALPHGDDRFPPQF